MEGTKNSYCLQIADHGGAQKKNHFKPPYPPQNDFHKLAIAVVKNFATAIRHGATMANIWQRWESIIIS